MNEKHLWYLVKRQFKMMCLSVLVVCMALAVCSVETEAKTKPKAKYEAKINKKVYTLKKGKTVKLKVSKNKAAKKKKVIWTSSNKKVATVSSSGKVKAKKNGKAKITAKLKGTKVKVTCKIIVGTPVSSVKLNKRTATLKAGEKLRLTAAVSPKKATTKKVTYKSSQASVASVSASGVVTALRPGTAKITATTADGTGKSAVCNIKVENGVIAVSKVNLSDSALSLTPGQTKKITAAVEPANATNKELAWTSSNTDVVTVDKTGTVKAVGEGTAAIKVSASNGVSASCSVKVAYSGAVDNQADLEKALSSKMLTKVTFHSESAGQVTIPAGDYTDKTLEIYAPKAEVTNSGQFEKVIINAIASNTYEENASNVIYFNAEKGRVIIGENAVATVNLSRAGNQKFHLENRGYVNSIYVPGKTSLRLEGKNLIPVMLAAEAKGSAIVTSAELKITSDASWNMTLLPGSENSRATVADNSCLPSVDGVGYIPVTVNKENDIVNILARVEENSEINQKVNVEGKVLEYSLADASEPTEAETAEKQAISNNSQGAKVYILPYTTENNMVDANNYKNYLSKAASAETDEKGDFHFTDIRIGNYWLIIEKEGYNALVKSIMITSNNTEMYSCGTATLLSNEIAECDNAPQISGIIKDSLTGESVNASGIQVKLRKGAGNIIGEVLQKTETDKNGKYIFKDVPAGVYTVEALDVRQNLSGGSIRYNAASTDIVVAYNYLAADGYDCVIDQRIEDVETGKGKVQFTLTWGNEASGASADIDSHLVGPKADGTGSFHVYYSNESYEANGVRMADLDVDDTDYEGPEHTTIYKETNGIYRFYVHNFSEKEASGSDKLAASSVRVRVTIGERSYAFNCPNKKGNLWYVCDYNSMTHTITPKNEVSDFLLDEAYIGLSDKEIAQMEKERVLEYAGEVKEYLLRFVDNAAKTGYADRIKAIEAQVKDTDSGLKLAELRGELESLRESLADVYYNSISVSADNLIYYNSDVVYEYDDNDVLKSARPVITCAVSVGDVLTNFTVFCPQDEETGEDFYEAKTSASQDPEYQYVIRVKHKATGLEQDVYVKVLGNQGAADILLQMTYCRDILCEFEECEELRIDKERLTAIVSEAGQLKDNNEYDKLIDEIRTIGKRYEKISNELSVLTVTGDGVEYWWESKQYIYDDNDNWLGGGAVLNIERSSSVTDEEVLSKISIGFEDGITQEILASDWDVYPKMIKASNGTFTKKIYISVTEY